ncbi:hypothetical protein [Desulfonema magnum]|uniref:ABC transporter, solute-binding protein n=1 Tax=Desulfonema magnum TaxID=45655 RepID=A0A975GPR5_9BACT|nr:hypothetical protein [Desulfonema magnum]QTA89127.1 putative ABC transporter, solute-binding protein [Desulfonema magnum]
MRKVSASVIFVICCFLTFGPAVVHCETDKYKIGISSWVGFPSSVKGFKDSLAAEGLTEGENVTFLSGKSDGDKNKQHAIAEHFKKERVDLVYSLCTSGTFIIKKIGGVLKLDLFRYLPN